MVALEIVNDLTIFTFTLSTATIKGKKFIPVVPEVVGVQSECTLLEVNKPCYFLFRALSTLIEVVKGNESTHKLSKDYP